ncbi:hypothetical protein CDAR_117281 [Caerostris darwini]|uniref:Uncharacterized protein n=1 Tax=Caerostris darwini TaxID=1538125 RepID=A0AAV4SPZ1_9ARAC|nr:hypothetical protein CDAR_117281 [Caerostris darwini]
MTASHHQTLIDWSCIGGACGPNDQPLVFPLNSQRCFYLKGETKLQGPGEENTGQHNWSGTLRQPDPAAWHEQCNK